MIHQATWSYIKAGYCPLFLGAMLPLMRNTYKNPFCPSVGKIKTFLLKFYTLIEESLGDPFSQTSRLLYVVTLLGFLNVRTYKVSECWQIIRVWWWVWMRFRCGLHGAYMWSEWRTEAFVREVTCLLRLFSNKIALQFASSSISARLRLFQLISWLFIML